MKQRTLHGRDEHILDPQTHSLDNIPAEDESAFQDWLARNGYSSKEEFYIECQMLNDSEW